MVLYGANLEKDIGANPYPFLSECILIVIKLVFV